MNSKDDQQLGTALPVIVILISMAFLVGGLILTMQPVAHVRVWIPAQSSGASTGGERASSPCLSEATCNRTDPV